MSVSSDDMRIFQALCTETDRLVSALRRGKVTAADVAHCVELRDRYADKVRAALTKMIEEWAAARCDAGS